MPAEIDIDHEIHGGCSPRPGSCHPDHAISELAEGQHGVVSREQLAVLGLGKGAIDHRVAIGRLHPRHKGGAIGHRLLSIRGRWMAAVLACGHGTLLSHLSAAALWDVYVGTGSTVDVLARRSVRGRPGISVHRVSEPHPDDRAVLEGIPVTSLPRTLLGLAEVLRPRRLRRAFEQAERLRVLDLRAVRALIDRSSGRRGVVALRALVAEGRELPDTRSWLERRFVELCRDAGLAPPAMNTAVAGYVVDALWVDQRLIVELDGYEFHHNRTQFERDRVRDGVLQLEGYRVLRITYGRLRQQPAAVVEILRQLL